MSSLHTRASLAAAAAEIRIGKREPANAFEKAAALFLDLEPAPVALDVEAALRASLFSALLSQAVRNAPATLSSSPALLHDYVARVTAQVREKAPVAGMSLVPFEPAKPPSVEAAAAERAELEQAIALANPFSSLNARAEQAARAKQLAPERAREMAKAQVEREINRHLADARKANPKTKREDIVPGSQVEKMINVAADAALPAATAALERELAAVPTDQTRSALVADKAKRGDFGSLGRCLDCVDENGEQRWSADDQAKMQLVNRAQKAGLFGHLATLRVVKTDAVRTAEVVRPLVLSSTWHVPHVGVVGAQLLFVAKKRSDQAPAELLALVDGLGRLERIELEGNGSGWAFVPAANAAEAA